MIPRGFLHIKLKPYAKILHHMNKGLDLLTNRINNLKTVDSTLSGTAPSQDKRCPGSTVAIKYMNTFLRSQKVSFYELEGLKRVIIEKSANT